MSATGDYDVEPTLPPSISEAMTDCETNCKCFQSQNDSDCRIEPPRIEPQTQARYNQYTSVGNTTNVQRYNT